MTPTKSFSRNALTAGLLLIMAAVPATVSSSDDERAVGELHRRIEKAFVRCDAKEMKGTFSRRVKTYVASKILGIKDGYYGSDQMVLFFHRLFKGRTTVRFEVLVKTPRTRKDGSAVLPARWIYREGGTTSSEVRLSFVVAPEPRGWRIREFRDLK